MRKAAHLGRRDGAAVAAQQQRVEQLGVYEAARGKRSGRWQTVLRVAQGDTAIARPSAPSCLNELDSPQAGPGHSAHSGGGHALRPQRLKHVAHATQQRLQTVNGHRARLLSDAASASRRRLPSDKKVDRTYQPVAAHAPARGSAPRRRRPRPATRPGRETRGRGRAAAPLALPRPTAAPACLG